MKKILLGVGIALFATAAQAGRPSVAPPSLPDVTGLELGKDFDTPTCSFANEKGVTIFADTYDYGPVMKLDGQIAQFRLLENEKGLWDYQKQDEQISTKYVYGDLTIEIKGKVVDACEENEEGCEYTEMKVDAVLTNGTDSKEFKELTGGCGV